MNKMTATIYPDKDGDFVIFLGTPRQLRRKGSCPKHICARRKFRSIIGDEIKPNQSVAIYIHENFTDEEVFNYFEELYLVMMQPPKESI